MGWSIGTGQDGRDIGYGVPALCDKPGCNEVINRGLDYCCGGYWSDHGCGLYFCGSHQSYRTPRGEDNGVNLCPRCYRYRSPYEPKEDVEEWQHFKLEDESWATWRSENPELVEKYRATVAAVGEHQHDW